VKGRSVGDAREVRVFDVNNVKGMEFEAVFLVGIDDWPSAFPIFLRASFM
jgi:hypothetical protein